MAAVRVERVGKNGKSESMSLVVVLGGVGRVGAIVFPVLTQTFGMVIDLMA